MNSMRITVIGAGYVGLTTGAGLATIGHTVTVVERDTTRVVAINAGTSPLFEAGLDEAVASSVRHGRLSATDDLDAAVAVADIVMFAVGTPMSDSGHADITDLENAFDSVVAVSRPDTVIIIKSTAPVGTFRALIERTSRPVRLTTNPEFLRQGTALQDFLHPDRIVIGADNSDDGAVVAAMYEPMAAAGARIMHTTPESAELIKYASNAFLATKLSFVNEIANLAELAGADIEEITEALGLDPRIGSRYLNPGPGFGGSCLPKDTAAFLAVSERFGSSSHVVTAATRVNRDRIALMADKIERAIGDDLTGRRISVLGVTFKAGTDDVRDSPAVPIIEMLHKRGAIITLFDPQGMHAAATLFPWANQATSLSEAIAASPTAVIVTEWPEFAQMDPSTLDIEHLIDLRNMYRPTEFDGKRTLYVSIGRRDSVPAHDHSTT